MPVLPSSRDEIELGFGVLNGEQWRLTFEPEARIPPDEHHFTHPLVLLYIGDRGGSGRPRARDVAPGTVGRWTLVVRRHNAPAHVFGEVAFGSDRVEVHCVDNTTVEAVVVDCADHLPFNYYVAEVARQVVRVTASGPDGRTATRSKDDR